MKTLLKLFLLHMALAPAVGQVFGQQVWTKYAGNPVMQQGSPGSWDYQDIYALSVLFRDSVYHLYYTGSDGSNDYFYKRSGYARSRDGITWTKHPDAVLNVGSPGAWDAWDAEAWGVLYASGQHKMWYNGYSTTQWYQQIGYASGVNETTWTKRPTPILSPGASGAWDDASVMGASVLPSTTGGGYKMWYTGWDGSPNWTHFQIGYATATSETTWTKHPLNPVLPLGPSGSWDDGSIFCGTVVYDSVAHLYYMFYTGMHRDLGDTQIGYATSGDGISWTKYAGNPVLSPGAPGSWDQTHLVGGGVVIVRDTFRLWYRGIDPNGFTRIGYATSPRVRVGVQLRVPQDYATIQAAIDASSDGDTVLVAEGTYRENIRYRGKAIVLGSRFLLDGDTAHIARTIIDGSGSTKADSASVVYFVNGEDTTSVLTGFTIRGGSGTISPWSNSAWGTFQSWAGGGIFCHNAGARVTHNIVEKNRVVAAVCQGAGIYAVGTGSSYPFIIVEDNWVRDNYLQGTGTTSFLWPGGGGIALAGVEARVVQNTIERDTATGAMGAYGGGISLTAYGNGRWPGGHFARNLIRKNLTRAALEGAGGAGMMIMYTGPVTLQENTIEGNLATSTASNGWAQGGGVCITDQGITGYGRKVLLNNRFLGNAVSCSFSNDGAGLLIYRTLATISANEFTENTVAGLGLGGGGGISLYQSSFRLENSIFTRNTSRVDGGALLVTGYPQSGSEQLLVNNTIVDNHASATGAGMRVNLAPGLVALNTIFWGDTSGTGGEINTVDARPTVQYCDVQGGYTGIGNIAADPQLALPRLDSLKTTSPCIGAGTATSVPLVDIHGHPRPQPAGSNPDIGAEESSQDNPTFGVEEEHALPSAFVLSQNYPNPFNPTTTIRYSLPHRCTVTLLIYNTLGQLVATLVNGSVDAGYHEVQFNAGNLASGVYFYRLQAGSFTDVKKLLLME